MSLSVPFVSSISGGVLSPGHLITVAGVIPPSSTWFAINLQTGANINPRSDIALHINPRFSNQVVIRNSLTNQHWGIEENSGYFPFVSGQPFEVKIFSDPNHFKIAVNGQHYCEFNHRIPINYINTLVVDGEVQLNHVEGVEGGHSGGMLPYPGHAPPPNLPPYPVSSGSAPPAPYPTGAPGGYPTAGGTAYPAGGGQQYPAGYPQGGRDDKGMFGLSTGQMVVGGLGAAGAAYLGTKLGKKAMKKMKKKGKKKFKHKRGSSSSSSGSSGSGSGSGSSE